MGTDYLKCLGLDSVMESDEALTGFLSYLAAEGKYIPTYGSDHIDFRKITGYPEFIVTTIPDEKEKTLKFSDFYTHCCGPDKWTFRITDTLVNKPLEGKRQILASPIQHEGMCIVNIAQPDIVPSYFSGECIDLQVVAFPYDIKYYKDEEEYESNETVDCKLGKLCNAVGSVLPVAFLNNHHESGEPDETDDIMAISGKVISVHKGMVDIGGEEVFAFIDCYIDTFFGRLEIAHTLDQVDEAQRDNIKPGSVVCGLFVLSGDPMVDEYSDGAVFDREHILRYLGTVMTEKETDTKNLGKYLSDDCTYYSETTGSTVQDKEEIINHIEYVKTSRSKPYDINCATIIGSYENAEYPEGQRCLLLSAKDADDYESIVFADFDEEDKISRIYICTDAEYKFESDVKDTEDDLCFD